MALKALDIYKLLPKKNCKECGDQTCLTFAMKLAQGKGEPDACPYLDDNAKAVLGASTRPPIQKITIGMGSRAFTVGEEFVFYRHEKTYYHQPGIVYLISDMDTEESIREVARQVRENCLTRIGIDLLLNGVAVRADSGSGEQFSRAVRIVSEGGDLPLVLIAPDPAVMEKALEICGNYAPVIGPVTPDNVTEFCEFARKYGVTLVLKGDDLPGLATLSEKCLSQKVQNLMLDLSGSSGRYVREATLTRQLALSREVTAFGYPVFMDASESGLSGVVTGIAKFASVIVTPPLQKPEMDAALVMRQNIYTDPQKPIQITPGLYRIGTPGKDDLVFLTVNFSLTYFTLQGYLEATRRSCWLLIVDTEGMSVLTAVAAGKLNEFVIKDAITLFKLADEVNHKTLIIPGYASPLSGRIEEVSGWNVIVGPRDAAEIASFIEEELKV
ncbi:MAG: acetyl-CoA decarbonylase/synthase complex subunit gamma [Methanospirillum sp.]|nr:acetyl-CoA decarbonylase/synthase complex subunit gamma [Methanospirillum sp.]